MVILYTTSERKTKPMRTKQAINITIDPLLIQKLDANRGKSQEISRSSLIEQAVRLYFTIENSDNRHQKSA